MERCDISKLRLQPNATGSVGAQLINGERDRERELKLRLSKMQPWSGKELDRWWGRGLSLSRICVIHCQKLQRQYINVHYTFLIST